MMLQQVNIKDSPWFHLSLLPSAGEECALSEGSARHISKVLRMRSGETVVLADGRGGVALAKLSQVALKACRARVLSVEKVPRSQHQLTLAVAMIKNIHRWEWMIEKCSELGVSKIIPITCERTTLYREKRARWQQIIQSAMLQSQNAWGMELAETTALHTLDTSTFSSVYMAYCGDAPTPKLAMKHITQPQGSKQLILIGPEGDFSAREVQPYGDRGVRFLDLGYVRLRTETAAIYVAAQWHSYVS